MKQDYNQVIRSIEPEVVSGLSEEEMLLLTTAIASEETDELTEEEQSAIGKLLNDGEHELKSGTNISCNQEGCGESQTKNI